MERIQSGKKVSIYGGEKNGFWGKKHTEETLKKMIAFIENEPEVPADEKTKCDLCSKQTDARWFTSIDGMAYWLCRDCHFRSIKEDGLETRSLTENDEADAIVKQMKKHFKVIKE